MHSQHAQKKVRQCKDARTTRVIAQAWRLLGDLHLRGRQYYRSLSQD